MMLPVRNLSKCLLLTALLVGAVSTASADATYSLTNLNYTLSGTKLVLTSPDPSTDASINSQAFMGLTSITEVIIPDNVKTISTSAFQDCTGLTEIILPPSLTSIGEYAFKDCSSLVSVLCLPQTAPTLGGSAFVGCASGLIICVPNLGSYNNTGSWNNYKLISNFLDENDEVEVAERKISYFRSNSWDEIDIYRTLRKVGSFNTLCLPFKVPDIATSPLAGAEVYEFVGATVEDNALKLNITPLVGSALTAGTPYLIKWNSGDELYNMHFSDITWDSDQTAQSAGTGQVTFHGIYGMTHIGDATNGEQHLNLFLGANNTLYWPSDGRSESAKMLGFRAWFQITSSNPAPVHRGMPAVLNIVDSPTEIESLSETPVPATQKVLRDGQLIIIKDGVSYSITGQKL